MAGQLINCFMWGYQPHFRHNVKFAAEGALKTIGLSVDVTVFLVGLLADGYQGNPLCIEPEDGPVTPDDFDGLQERARARYEADPDSQLIHSDARLHELRHRGLHDLAIGIEIAVVLERMVGQRFLASYPTQVEGYRVFTLVGVAPSVMEEVPRLTTESRERMRITQSLPRGVIDEVLDASSRALHFPEPGSGFGLGVDSDDIARTAARRLTESAVVLSGNVFGHGFFDAMNQVSTTRYEKRVGVGRFLLGSSKSADMEQQLSLRDAVPVREIRTLRKLLEVSRGRGSAVLTDGSLAFGFGELKGAYDPATESVFEVVISGHGRWDLRHAEQGLVAFENGAPRLPQQRLSRERFANIASRVFVNSACDVEKLWAMSEAAADAEHGTMLVVSAAAVEESERLRGQALALEPTSIEPILVRQVTSIDGAVLVKPDGDVVAIGVILDGLATGSGDRARGARFNSALRYLEAGRAPTLIVLVSEDGLINLLPDLRPQVSRAEIAFLMDRLRAAADIDPVDPEKFYDVFKELEARAFYLDQDQVDEVNSLREDHWNRRREAGAQVWIVDSPLKPDPEMSDEYLVD